MTDLLTPEEVRDWLQAIQTHGIEILQTRLGLLCRDYLTLWDRNKELEKLTAYQDKTLRWFNDRLLEAGGLIPIEKTGDYFDHA